MTQETPLFTRLLDAGAFLSLDYQLHLMQLLGARFDFDLVLEEGYVDLVGTNRIRAAVHPLGIQSAVTQSWVWAWSESLGIREERTVFARTLRDYGTAQRVPEFTIEEIPTVAGVNLWQSIAVAAKTATGFSRGAHLPAPTIEGSTALLLLEHPDLALPEPTVQRVRRVLTETLQSDFAISDHRSAVRDYCARRRLGMSEPTPREVAVVAPDGRVTLTFDDAGRVVGLA